MQLCHRAGHAVPLLTVFTILAGCATSTVPQPDNFNQNPKVVAIYAVDSAFGTLPDVLIFSSDAADSSRLSADPPPSYGSYRVEFDQPVNGATVANNANRATDIGGVASFCSPLGNAPVQLLDLASGSPAPMTSSVCYDATSALGSHPHIVIVPGDASDPVKAPPLTCNTFTPNGGVKTLGGNVLAPNHRYGIQVKPDIKNAADKPLAAPVGTGWVGDTFVFTTSQLKIMAAGHVDATSGFLVWLDKPELGFEKDLAPCATTGTCPDVNGNNTASTYQKPADSSPFIVVLTEPLTGATGVTLTRTDATNSNPDARIAINGGVFGDPRIIEIRTGDTFEPGQGYQVVVPAGPTGIKAVSGDTLPPPNPTNPTYTFVAQPGTAGVLSTAPANGAQAQGHTDVPVTVAFTTGDPPVPTTDTTNVAAKSVPVVEFSSPIAADAAGKPAGTFALTTGTSNTPVPATVAFSKSRNQQRVVLTPSAPLQPATTYQVSWKGVTGAAPPKGPASFSGQPFSDDSVQFTTATFRIAVVHDPAVDTALSTDNEAATVRNLDRRTDIEPADVRDAINVAFNAPASGVSTSTLTIGELGGTSATATPIAGFTVTPVDATDFKIALPASYQPKYGQKYEVRATPGITSAGKALSAEGCNTSDCSDVKSFTTRKVSVQIAADPNDAAPTGFTVNFSDPIDPASITPFLTDATANPPKAGEFKLFARDANGALATTSTPIKCVITDPVTVTCTAVSSLGTAPASFLASAVFLPTATQDSTQGGPSGPAIVDASVSKDPSARFSGNASGSVFGACPAP